MSKKGFISKLTEEIKKLPHGVKYDSPEEAIEALRRAGVKDAELEYSGLEELLRPGHVPGLGLSKTSLEMADAKRPDIFDFKDRRAFEFPGQNMPENLDELADAAESEYKHYSLPGDNYREHIYQFSNDPSQRNPDDILNTRSYSTHFQDVPNYMGHVRSTDEIVDGKPTLNIQEVQSDVLGHPLRKGQIDRSIDLNEHITDDAYYKLQDIIDQFPTSPLPGEQPDALWDSVYEANAEELIDLLKPTGIHPDDVPAHALKSFIMEGDMPAESGYINTSGPGPDRFPNTKNYRERMLERSIDVAQDEGKEQLMVPLEDIPEIRKVEETLDTVLEKAWGFDQADNPEQEYIGWFRNNVEGLERQTGQNLSEWTDDQILHLMNAGTDEFNRLLPPVPPETPHYFETPALNTPIDHHLHRGDHIQKQEYDPKKGRVPKALKKIARDQGMEYKTIEKDGVRYGLLDFKGKKKKPTELYSVGGLLGAGALNQIMQDPSQDVR